MDEKNFLSEVTGNDYINHDLYGKYNVKRGLRNADGTGVLVGLTNVGDVHGYIMDEGEKTPVEGKLYYRGIDVEEIIKNAAKEGRLAFEEAAYLLMLGRLPSKTQLAHFEKLLSDNRALPAGFAEDSIMKLPSKDVMNKLGRSVLTLYSYDDNPDDNSPENVFHQCIKLIAQMPTIVAYCYMAKKYYFDHESLVIHFPPEGASTAESFLTMVRSDKQFTHLEAEILDMALVLHAEHGGGNNSTFAVHLLSSAETDTYAAITAGINSLKGFKHGGANLKVMKMMADIKKNVKNWADEGEVADYLTKIVKGEVGDHLGLIYGQGHPVYTLSDPRAVLLSQKAGELVAQLGNGLDEEFNLYRLIERLAPGIVQKVTGSDKPICTNVDFYSGFVYKMLGIPQELYTPIFAMARIVGWCAHRMEEIVAGGRIIRPAYKCVQPRRKYEPMTQRG
jgi:citrate synthase